VSEPKYIQVNTVGNKFDCVGCFYNGNCKVSFSCRNGFHYERNPAYKPPSQRVRELIESPKWIDDDSIELMIIALANELEQEEKVGQ
jgi:hypothetical protein